MAKLKDLDKYVNYEFSSGCYTGEDYKAFQTKYINFLKAICRNNHWKLVNVGKNHYCFSAFIKGGTENKYVYLSISDATFQMNGTSIFLSELQKTKSITTAVLINTPRLKI